MANEVVKKENVLALVNQSKEDFAALMVDAKKFDAATNAVAAFEAADLILRFEHLLSEEVMQNVFIPLMNKKIGFKTDKDPTRKDKKTGTYPTPYSVPVVRTCIIDAVLNGLMPTGNQFNIIAGTMYPTKEGYTALLNKLKNSDLQLFYTFEFDPETKATSADPTYVAIPCRIAYKTAKKDMSGWFKYTAMVKSNGETSTTDQLRGKAERKCKKAFYEFLTGIDLGDGDADTVDTTYVDVTPKAETAAERAKRVLAESRAAKVQETPQNGGNGLTEEEMRQAELDLIAEEEGRK